MILHADALGRRTKPSRSNKLAKLLGEDSFAQIPTNVLPPQAQTVPAPLVPAPVPERPWYLGEDYDPSEIVFDNKGTVKAGTLRALVARLTPHGSTGMSPSYLIEG
jgi:son of sevenless-like protein